MLLHDLDLTVTSGGSTWYGNDIINDELNNVEQIYIETPTAGDEYIVTVSSNQFTEANTQNVSIIISSAGSVTNINTISSDANTINNVLNCASNEQMMTIRMLDRGGDGWTNASYVIKELIDGIPSAFI